MTAAFAETTTRADRALTITRLFDAPRHIVFKMWTDPQHLKNWMGPRGYTADHLSGDLRPGGAWRSCLHQDDGGRDLWKGGVYREIVESERLVFTFAWDDEDGKSGPETLITVTFADEQGKTRMVFHQEVFDTVANRDGHRGGWSSSFDRLEEYVAATA
jgi:uncharacterized protein YndB with AHSA1/START domain